MTCPRCGALTEQYPCPVCGWSPEQPQAPASSDRAKRRRAKRRRRLLAILGCALLVIALAGVWVLRDLFGGKWIEPEPPRTEPDIPAAALPETPAAPEPAPPEPPWATVVLDPGHGGDLSPGVAAGDSAEREVNLAVALELKALLEEENIEVVLTRTQNDQSVSLRDRIRLANDIGADAFLSLHCNSFDKASVRGFEMFYYKAGTEGQALAECFHRAAEEAGIVTRDCQPGNYQVLRDADVPAALAEMGYFTNADDLRLLTDPAYQSKLAAALLDGLLDWLKKE